MFACFIVSIQWGSLNGCKSNTAVVHPAMRMPMYVISLPQSIHVFMSWGEGKGSAKCSRNASGVVKVAALCCLGRHSRRCAVCLYALLTL